jgi:two-component system, OmpR family, sensor histidine kinase KdpD
MDTLIAMTAEFGHSGWLLAGLLLLSAGLGTALVRARRQARAAKGHAEREERLRQWSDTLRDASDPATHAQALHDALVAAGGVPVAVIVLTALPALREEPSAVQQIGEADADQRAGLTLCVQLGEALGPQTARHTEQPDLYLPLRGRGVTLGAAVLRGLGHQPTEPSLCAHAQALCDQMGLALQRSLSAHAEQAARELAREQGVRNALLAAISHDYRTPLASIMSAASSLEQQADRLGAEQRRQLAAGIVQEVKRLSRLADNTLQLARLDAPGVVLRCDWESAEEIVGTALRRVRKRDEGRQVRARLEPGLPLLWCDAMLVSQLLDNLIDNALKYGGPEAPVEVLVRRIGERMLLAVRDRGPGIAPAWRERVFEVFQRGADAATASADARQRPGAGVGLAVCRAIARVHGGELRLRPRGHGGSSFECLLPLREPPPHLPESETA